MAVTTAKGRNSDQFQLMVSRKWRDDNVNSRDTTPGRTRVSTASELPPPPPSSDVSNAKKFTERKVPVVYYLSRNGQLEHPHFMEVPLSSSDGLYLKDVINRLNFLRGNGMATLYSWSAKRSYKNGFVWHDLAENDLIHPAHGHEYILKGSEVPEPLLISPDKTLLEKTPSSRSLQAPKSSSSGEESDITAVIRRRNQSWSSIDLNEYKVYKTESLAESTRRPAADASTQTDDKRRRRRQVVKEEIQEIEERHEEKSREAEGNREEIEISPPPSDSSPETLESLLKADGRSIFNGNRTVDNCGRMKASAVLMQLLSCGSISFRDCGATMGVKEPCGGRMPRGGGGNQVLGTSKESSSFARVRLEDKEYFSGSLIETKKEEAQVPALKKSNSYNADRSSHLQLTEKEIEGVRTKCIPRKTKAMSANKSTGINVHGEEDSINKNSQLGSKRMEAQNVENEGQ